VLRDFLGVEVGNVPKRGINKAPVMCESPSNFSIVNQIGVKSSTKTGTSPLDDWGNGGSERQQRVMTSDPWGKLRSSMARGLADDPEFSMTPHSCRIWVIVQFSVFTPMAIAFPAPLPQRLFLPSRVTVLMCVWIYADFPHDLIN
jgi:hypothetical protein